jgi:hypothetical protein
MDSEFELAFINVGLENAWKVMKKVVSFSP